jgi:hypothetical protein
MRASISLHGDIVFPNDAARSYVTRLLYMPKNRQDVFTLLALSVSIAARAENAL